MNHYDNEPIAGILSNALVGIAIWAVLIWAVHYYISLPTVATTIDGNCVYVQYPDGQKWTCEEIPKKHHSIVVADQ